MSRDASNLYPEFSQKAVTENVYELANPVHGSLAAGVREIAFREPDGLDINSEGTEQGADILELAIYVDDPNEPFSAGSTRLVIKSMLEQ